MKIFTHLLSVLAPLHHGGRVAGHGTGQPHSLPDPPNLLDVPLVGDRGSWNRSGMSLVKTNTIQNSNPRLCLKFNTIFANNLITLPTK